MSRWAFQQLLLSYPEFQVSSEASGDAELHCRGRPWGHSPSGRDGKWLWLSLTPQVMLLESLRRGPVTGKSIRWNLGDVGGSHRKSQEQGRRKQIMSQNRSKLHKQTWDPRSVERCMCQICCHMCHMVSYVSYGVICWESCCAVPQVSEWLLPVFVEHDRSSHAERMAQCPSSVLPWHCATGWKNQLLGATFRETFGCTNDFDAGCLQYLVIVRIH